MIRVYTPAERRGYDARPVFPNQRGNLEPGVERASDQPVLESECRGLYSENLCCLELLLVPLSTRGMPRRLSFAKIDKQHGETFACEL
jgi:hypothetical protein